MKKAQNFLFLLAITFLFVFTTNQSSANETTPTPQETMSPTAAVATTPAPYLDSQGMTIELKKRPEVVNAKSCLHCHLKRKEDPTNNIKNLERNHQEKNNMHGKLQLSCNQCHDRENHNLLKMSVTREKTDFNHPSAVCQQCHGHIFKDWSKGMHGKRTGGWNLKKTQFQCIDCHNPHSVTFPKMQADPPPNRPHMDSEHKHEHNNEHNSEHSEHSEHSDGHEATTPEHH